MYKVKIDGEYIYHPWDNDLQIYDASTEEELNKNGTFEFHVLPDNPKYESIKKLKTEVVVIRTNNSSEDEIFRGRVMSDDIDFDGDKTVKCEGDLGYFIDTPLPKYKTTATPEQHFKNFVSYHNQYADNWKKFEIGNITVSADAFEIECYTFPTIRKAMEDYLIGNCGGYIQTRKSNGIYYVDYLEKIDTVSDQVIQFGENLIDLTKYIKADDVKTCVIPLGATNSATGEPKTIDDINDGKFYVRDDSAANLFGNIFTTIEYTDISDPYVLKEKAVEELGSLKNMTTTIELTALELSDIGVNVSSIKVGDNVRVISKKHNIDTYMQVSKKKTDLKKPDDSNITLGTTIRGLTDSQVDYNNGAITLIGYARKEAGDGIAGLRDEMYQLPSLNMEALTNTELEKLLT